MAQRERKYCGDSEVLPDGYDRFGSRYECLRTGIGVGLYVIPEQRQRKALAQRRPLTKQELERIASRLGVQAQGRTKGQLLNAIIITLERRG